MRSFQDEKAGNTPMKTALRCMAIIVFSSILLNVKVASADSTKLLYIIAQSEVSNATTIRCKGSIEDRCAEFFEKILRDREIVYALKTLVKNGVPIAIIDSGNNPQVINGSLTIPFDIQLVDLKKYLGVK